MAGAIHVQHTVLHEQSVIVTTNDHIEKVCSFPPPFARRCPYIIALPMQLPYDNRTRGELCG